MLEFSKTESRALPGQIIQSIVALSRGGKPHPFVSALNSELRKVNPDLPMAGANSLVIPCRALTTNVFTGGGALVGNDQLDIAAMLRPASVAVRAGARVETGLRGNVSLPRELTGTTFAWLGEGETASETDGTFGQLSLTPHRVAGASSITAQLEAVSGGLASRFLMASLARGIGSAIDRAILNGSGVAGEPAGIYATAGVNAVTFGAAATLAKVCDFEDDVSDEDVDDENISFIAHPSVREKWRQLQRWTGASLPLWTDEGRVIGRPAQVSTHMPAAGIVCGDFSQCLVTFWGSEDVPVTIIVNPFSAADEGKIKFVVQAYADVGLIRPEAFCKNSDSAIQ